MIRRWARGVRVSETDNTNENYVVTVAEVSITIVTEVKMQTMTTVLIFLTMI